MKDAAAQNSVAEIADTPMNPENGPDNPDNSGNPGEPNRPGHSGESAEPAGPIDFMKLRAESRLAEIPEASWTTVIDSRKTLFSFPWKELWDYRDLIFLLFYRDFSSTYKQTILGPLWYWVQPFMQTMVLTLVFSTVGGMSTDGLPPFLFYLSGMACWTFFADCLNKGSLTFTSNAYLFGKIYFPRLAAPIATVGMCLVNFFMVFSLFLLMYVVFILRGAHIHPDWRLVVLPVLILQMTLIGMGTGFVVTALTTRYKDLAVVVTFGTQLWMYGSCVVFPLTMIPARFRPFMALNPMVTVIESFRFAFFGVGTVFLWQLITSFIVTLAIFVVGLVLFNKVERTFTDTI